MDRSTIKQYGHIVKEINELKAEIDKLKKDPRNYNNLIAVLDDQTDHLCRLREDIEARLWRLTSMERRIIRKKYFEGKSYKQIAEEMKYSPETLKVAARVALRKMED